MSRNGHRPWRLRVRLPAGYDEDTQPLFDWLREWLIPACLNAPIKVTLELRPPPSGVDQPGNEEDPNP